MAISNPVSEAKTEPQASVFNLVGTPLLSSGMTDSVVARSEQRGCLSDGDCSTAKLSGPVAHRLPRLPGAIDREAEALRLRGERPRGST